MPHVLFDPDSISWTELYAHPSAGPQFGAGGGYAVFRGIPFQRGTGIGSVFRSLLQRYLLPLGKHIGKEGLATTHRVLTQVLGGESLGTTLKEESREGVKNLLVKAADHLVKRKSAPQEGQGTLGRLSRKNINKQLISLQGKSKQGYYRTHLPPPPTATNYLNLPPRPKKKKGHYVN